MSSINQLWAPHPRFNKAMTVSAQCSLAVTWQGTKLRAWMAWHCVNRYGCFPPAVWAGSRNCRAELSGEQLKRTPTDSCAAARGGTTQCTEQVGAVRCTAHTSGCYSLLGPGCT